MPHIITDPEYRELTAYRRLGLSPDEIAAKLDYLTEPAPLPMTEDYRTTCGLLEDDDLELVPGTEGPIVNNDWERGL